MLLDKFRKYGFGDLALKWFGSFFSDREQYVCYNGKVSNVLPVNFGVVQGSSLGPICFLIYINDLGKCTNKLNFVKFADDTSVFVASPNLRECTVRVNEGLRCVKTWLDDNRLTLNVTKTSYMVIRRKQRLLDVSECSLFIGSVELERVSCVRFLGLHVDEHLLWQDQVDSVLKKVSRFIPIIYRVRNCLTADALKLLYNLIICPNMFYCNSVWASCSNSRLKLLNSVHNKLIRAITFKTRHDSVAPLYKSLNVLPLSYLREFSVGLYVYKCVNGCDNSFEFYASAHYNTRLSDTRTLVIPNIMSTHSRQSVRWTGVSLWNRLPCDLRAPQSVAVFKRKLRKFLLDSI